MFKGHVMHLAGSYYAVNYVCFRPPYTPDLTHGSNILSARRKK